MSNILKTALLFISFTIGLSAVNAQEKYAKAYEEKGDKAFNEGKYQQAMENYKMGKRFILNPLYLNYKIAEVCRMQKDYDKAEYWYQKVLIESDTLNINTNFPYLYLHLAEVAKCNGNTIQAQHFLNTLLLDCPDIKIRKQAKEDLETLRWIFDNDKAEENTTVVNLGHNVNNEFSQSSTFILRDSVLYFTTPIYKEEEEDGQKIYSDIYNQIFYSYIDEDFYTPAKPIEIGKINNKKQNISNFFFDTITNTIYFNKTEIRNNKEVSQIYYTQFASNKWSSPKLVKQAYDKKSSNMTPIIQRNEAGETYMYFASNRLGGFGGFDIWYVNLNNIDSQPVNLGNVINTQGDEITPHYCDDEQMLYFSSNYHKGFGGFDIFRSEGALNRWTTPENLLQPINSPANDMYPYVNISGEQGYFTSNRKSENNPKNKTCCNDLYRWDKHLPEVPTQKIVEQKAKFNPVFDLPIALYFHNDQPDPSSTLPTTETSYQECYKQYRLLSNQYKANTTRGLADSLEGPALEKMEAFFKEKVDKGMIKLDLLAEYLLEQAHAGKQITLHVRGYASALHDTEYNHTLSERRIVSLENYLKTWQNGRLQPYFEVGRITIERMPVGKLESTSENPTTLEEKRRSVFTLQAMQERRIEIRVVNVK
jgi:tetratricopeptide (TPR) repeat protein